MYGGPMAIRQRLGAVKHRCGRRTGRAAGSGCESGGTRAGHAALAARGIPSQKVEYLLPKAGKDYSADPRFYDCWTKLTPFSLVEYDRVVQLDSDMLVMQNMDELMEMELDGPGLAGKGKKVFAAGHACVCNPLKKPHYPKDW